MKPAINLELQGRYQLIERIALRGMGEVWRATDLLLFAIFNTWICGSLMQMLWAREK